MGFFKDAKRFLFHGGKYESREEYMADPRNREAYEKYARSQDARQRQPQYAPDSYADRRLPERGEQHERSPRNRSFGGAIGDVFNTITSPIRRGGDWASEQVRNFEQATGTRNVQIHAGTHSRYGNGFNNYGGYGGGYNNYGNAYGGRNSGVNFNVSGRWGNKGAYGEKGPSGASGESGDVRDTGFFKMPKTRADNAGSTRSIFFGDTTPNFLGRKDSIFAESPENKVFLQGFQVALGEYREIEKQKALQQKSQPGSQYEYSESAKTRQDMLVAVFEASMKHAAEHPKEYTGAARLTNMAGNEYGKEYGFESAGKFPEIKEKATIDKLKLAYAAAVNNNEQMAALETLWKNSNPSDEASLRYALDNFVSPARAEVTKELAPAMQAAHKALSAKTFTDQNARNVQETLLNHKEAWATNIADRKGFTVNMTEPNQFAVIADDNGGFLLRMRVVDSNPAFVEIPDAQLETAMATIGKLNAEKKTFTNAAPEIKTLVAGFDKKPPVKDKVAEADNIPVIELDTDEPSPTAILQNTPALFNAAIDSALKEIPKLQAAAQEKAQSALDDAQIEANAKTEIAAMEQKGYTDATKALSTLKVAAAKNATALKVNEHLLEKKPDDAALKDAAKKLNDEKTKLETDIVTTKELCETLKPGAVQAKKEADEAKTALEKAKEEAKKVGATIIDTPAPKVAAAPAPEADAAGAKALADTKAAADIAKQQAIEAEKKVADLKSQIADKSVELVNLMTPKPTAENDLRIETLKTEITALNATLDPAAAAQLAAAQAAAETQKQATAAAEKATNMERSKKLANSAVVILNLDDDEATQASESVIANCTKYFEDRDPSVITEMIAGLRQTAKDSFWGQKAVDFVNSKIPILKKAAEDLGFPKEATEAIAQNTMPKAPHELQNLNALTNKTMLS